MKRWALGIAAVGVLACDPAIAQQCQTTGVGQTCTNSILLSGGATGLDDGATATVTNTGSGTIAGSSVNAFGTGVQAVTASINNAGTISGTSTNNLGFGIRSDDVTAINHGTIIGSSANSQGYGISAGTSANVTNYGAIIGTGVTGFGIVAIDAGAQVINHGTITGTGTSAAGWGILAFMDTANVVNYGTISGSSVSWSGIGINAVVANVVNYGTISGSSVSGQGVGIQTGTANVTNAGVISGTTAAMQFFIDHDTLTVLPGSRIIGAIGLGGGGDAVNFRGGNHNLTFDTLVGATVSGTTPFAVLGNQVAAIDLTPFAMNWRTLNDFTRAASAAVPVFSGNGAPGTNGPLAFAAPDTPARVDDAFAAMAGLSAYSGEAMFLKSPTVAYADGTTIWARGFAGQRVQQQDGVLLHAANLFYGGMIGGDWQTRSGLRLGAFLGGGKTRTSIDLNQGGSDSDLVFGGAYARYDAGPTFLHAMVQAGGSHNTTSRNVNNNLAPNGLETANASFDGWYVSPEATLGHRFALGRLADAAYTLTPSLRVRYLYGAYDGYTETGSTANLSVGAQTVSTLEERGELKLTRTVSFTPNDALSASLSGGVLGTQRLGGNTVNAALLGQAIPFATPGKSDVWGGFGGAGLEWRSRNVTMFSAGEYLALSDNSTVIGGRAGLRIAF